MNYVIRLYKTKVKARKVVLPKALTDKYNWSKEDVFQVWRYNERILIIEPIAHVDFKTYFSEDGITNSLFHYLKPLKESISFGFYIPLDIERANNWQELEMLAVHDSGAKPIILEAFPNGTKKR